MEEIIKKAIEKNLEVVIVASGDNSDTAIAVSGTIESSPQNQSDISITAKHLTSEIMGGIRGNDSLAEEIRRRTAVEIWDKWHELEDDGEFANWLYSLREKE